MCGKCKQGEQLSVVFALVVVAFPSLTVQAGKGSGTIVDIASSDPQFKTFVAAVQAAGLVDTLKGKGPFTALAPPMQPSVNSVKPLSTRPWVTPKNLRVSSSITLSRQGLFW